MNKHLEEIFKDKPLLEKIQRRLPTLFEMAELECTRGGQTGMQVGSLREAIIIALFIYRFGPEKVKDFPITEHEKDVELFAQPLSIKTITSKGFGGIKASWTVDQLKSREFTAGYRPSSDMLFIQVNWGSDGGIYYIPIETQIRLLEKIGIKNYINLPKEGTNPRGNNFSSSAMRRLVQDKDTMFIPIRWPIITNKSDRSVVYKRWIDYWSE